MHILIVVFFYEILSSWYKRQRQILHYERYILQYLDRFIVDSSHIIKFAFYSTVDLLIYGEKLHFEVNINKYKSL